MKILKTTQILKMILHKKISKYTQTTKSRTGHTSAFFHFICFCMFHVTDLFRFVDQNIIYFSQTADGAKHQ